MSELDPIVKKLSEYYGFTIYVCEHTKDWAVRAAGKEGNYLLWHRSNGIDFFLDEVKDFFHNDGRYF